MPTDTLKLTVNVPVDMDIKYIDVWSNDTTKNAGKGYGASMSLKGTVDGSEVKVYPKGFLNKAIEALVKAGVIENGHYQHDPAEKYSIPVVNGEVRIMMQQAAGARYADFAVKARSGKMPAPGLVHGALLPNETGDEAYLNALTNAAPPKANTSQYNQTVTAPKPPVLSLQDRHAADVDLMKECLGYGLGIVVDAQKVVDGKADIVFTSEDARSIGISLFIKWTR